MKKLLSLPPNLVSCFHEITGYDEAEWFCTNDPVGHKLGSGGGSAWLLQSCYEQDGGGLSFDEWLPADRRLLLHAGGQSRRLPAYAPSGKVLTPIPVFRWERGQRLSQDLLSLQLPLYDRIMAAAPRSLHTMIVSGDVYIRATEPLQPIPEADVVCYGLWLDPETAKNHGVFVSACESPSVLECMLQKPSVQALGELRKSHFYLTDIGVWLLSDKAVKVLMRHSVRGGQVQNYDLYGQFGCCLGTHPTLDDAEIRELKVAVLPLPGGEFYHFGTSHELISSTLAIQNLVNDQREIMHHSLKPHPAMFVQNADVRMKITEANRNLWIENSCVGRSWTVAHDVIITGVPANDWTLTVNAGQCVDLVPIGEHAFAVRPYGYNDAFRGPLLGDTLYLGRPFADWAAERGIDCEGIEGKEDLQSARIFPVVANVEEAESVLRFMLNEPDNEAGRELWLNSSRLSADEISARANLRRLTEQRCRFRAANWPALARNHEHSVFYQVDLSDAAREFASMNIPAPDPLPETLPLMTRIHDAMFRSELQRLRGEASAESEQQAFNLLAHGLTAPVLSDKQSPKMNIYRDQIVWGRSPVRIDIAGGWTDTPPYCLMEGGNVINLAIELNGQQPIQTYVKPCPKPHIILRSIDLGAAETVTTFEQLADFNHVGSPFSIPKAALALAGFVPAYSQESFRSLDEQLQSFGCGIELTLLSAIPAGSGLGTSSILAANVLGALNDFCGLNWDKNEIGRRTLVLEQLLTTGGGWQDQFGGILSGVKLLQTSRGFNQVPEVRWLPDTLFADAEYSGCHLLYYTGITRTAKNILAEIVRRMFLNQHDEINLLREMKEHSIAMYEAIQRGNFSEMGALVRKTWQQNQLLDSGTNPPPVQHLTSLIDDLCLGYKLPGAGGGGYLYMIAKDPEAASRIIKTLSDHRLNDNARFVRMSLSHTGMQVSRS
ncbi:bifunctional fucokinase/fucose-1-phosphate guanylyltransferase [Prevotella sp. kh1p2]|uniref:bifunctional fucokinase/fucose-1-phosphate guanylyltransferase n=1 Tax=Prevotella sp. kh1p2 TaxID=1761883 RepID=UPI0008C58F37|nr:bifunctional fucokinase/fucose-1-phosphate guanylyltransferase [Prevotella sp. kh1p2]SES75606.1 Predicted kinase [Prevotella sp. kh1p2]SNU10513.1 Predicted kinase [Prevotellaceae bacterium KH2P17]